EIMLRSHACWPTSLRFEKRTTLAAMQDDAQRLAPMLEVVVRDPGIGIPAEQLGYIFERFHRVPPQFTSHGEGIGLGLALCQRIVELHHGAIWAESVPGAGSQFHVLLPLSGGDDQAESE